MCPSNVVVAFTRSPPLGTPLVMTTGLIALPLQFLYEPVWLT
jgi:hypothetical protein